METTVLEGHITWVFIANAIALAGCILMVLVGFIKKRKQILLTQCVQFAILSVSDVMLGGISGMISNTVSIARNLFSLRWKLNAVWKIIFIIIQFVITLIFNDLGLVGWLPLLAAGAFTLVLDQKDEVILKAVIVFGQALWLVFDMVILSYTSAAFDFFAIVSNLIGIVMLLRDRRRSALTANEKSESSDENETDI